MEPASMARYRNSAIAYRIRGRRSGLKLLAYLVAIFLMFERVDCEH